MSRGTTQCEMLTADEIYARYESEWVLIADPQLTESLKVLSGKVLCHTLPPSATVDGLLGLDFFRGHQLTVDFQTGQITLT